MISCLNFLDVKLKRILLIPLENLPRIELSIVENWLESYHFTIAHCKSFSGWILFLKQVFPLSGIINWNLQLRI